VTLVEILLLALLTGLSTLFGRYFFRYLGWFAVLPGAVFGCAWVVVVLAGIAGVIRDLRSSFSDRARRDVASDSSTSDDRQASGGC
jgi:hypothetical protein